MSRSVYYAGGRTAATAATAGVVAAALWNPATAKRIEVREVWCAITTAGVANVAIRRITTRGTATLSQTLDADNAAARDAAPASGAILDLTYSAQPTVDGSELARWNLPAAIGAGVILPWSEPVVIPPGTGLAIVTPVAVAFPVADVTFVFEE